MHRLEKHLNSILRKKKKRRKEVKKMMGMGRKRESRKSKKMRINLDNSNYSTLMQI